MISASQANDMAIENLKPVLDFLNNKIIKEINKFHNTLTICESEIPNYNRDSLRFLKNYLYEKGYTVYIDFIDSKKGNKIGISW